jgi:hypothetical protein
MEMTNTIRGPFLNHVGRRGALDAHALTPPHKGGSCPE